MQIQNSKYHKCWEVTEQNGFKKIKFGDSKKTKDGSYVNCTWSGTLVGKAKEFPIEKDDKFNILSGQVFSDKVGDKWYTNVTIFEIEMSDGSVKTDMGNITEVDSSDDCPF